MTDLMAALIADSIFAQGSTVTLDDGSTTRAGFSDRPSRLQTGEPVNGFDPPAKQPVAFTLPAAAAVKSTDTLTYRGTTYTVDRVIPHAPGDTLLTQVVVAYKTN